MRAYSLTVSGSTIVSGSIEATGDMTASEDFLVKGSTKVAEYIYHQGDNDTFLRFRDNRVNLTAGGKSAIHYDLSDCKIIINTTKYTRRVQRKTYFHITKFENFQKHIFLNFKTIFFIEKF